MDLTFLCNVHYNWNMETTTTPKGNEMTTVTIIWNRVIDTLPAGHVMSILATGRPLSAYCTLQVPPFRTDAESVCDAVFHATNTQEGWLWDDIAAVMPEIRPHTSLSVGDMVVVDGEIYTCANFGWEKNDSMAKFEKSLAF